jgi:hypothetical protein
MYKMDVDFLKCWMFWSFLLPQVLIIKIKDHRIK